MLVKFGIIRKIDDLGRIVIPKEIRNILRIRNGNDLEIKMINNQIIIEKTENLKVDYYLQKIIKIFSINWQVDVLVTSIDRIVYSFLFSKRKLLNEKLDESIVKIIENRKEKYINDSSIINENSNTLIIPLVINGDLKGSLIILYGLNNNINYHILVDILKLYLE